MVGVSSRVLQSLLFPQRPRRRHILAVHQVGLALSIYSISIHEPILNKQPYLTAVSVCCVQTQPATPTAALRGQPPPAGPLAAEPLHSPLCTRIYGEGSRA